MGLFAFPRNEIKRGLPFLTPSSFFIAIPATLVAEPAGPLAEPERLAPAGLLAEIGALVLAVPAELLVEPDVLKKGSGMGSGIVY